MLEHGHWRSITFHSVNVKVLLPDMTKNALHMTQLSFCGILQWWWIQKTFSHSSSANGKDEICDQSKIDDTTQTGCMTVVKSVNGFAWHANMKLCLICLVKVIKRYSHINFAAVLPCHETENAEVSTKVHQNCLCVTCLPFLLWLCNSLFQSLWHSILNDSKSLQLLAQCRPQVAPLLGQSCGSTESPKSWVLFERWVLTEGDCDHGALIRSWTIYFVVWSSEVR